MMWLKYERTSKGNIGIWHVLTKNWTLGISLLITALPFLI